MVERVPDVIITAEVGSVAKGEIDVPRSLGERIETIGGTALLRECGKPIADISFSVMTSRPSAVEPPPRLHSATEEPFVCVMNGGPSSAATINNQQTLSGSHYVALRNPSQGYDPKTDLKINVYSSFVWQGTTLHIDPIGTAGGGLRSGIVPNWADNSETDADAASAVTAMAYDEYGTRGQPLYLVASSMGARRAALMVHKLAERGIIVKGMTILSGAYDKSILDYDNLSESRAYVNALASLAVSAHFHGRKNPQIKTSYDEDKPDREVFDEVLAFAQQDYEPSLRRLIQDGRLPSKRYKAIARKISGLIGLNIDAVIANDLRISPEFFSRNLLPNKIVSMIDSREIFDMCEVIIDPLLDSLADPFQQAQPIKGLTYHLPAIIQIPAWEDRGILSNGKAHAAMKRAFEINPKLAVNATNGIYDMNTPAPSTEVFWEEMYGLYDIPHIKHTENLGYLVTSTYPGEANTYILDMAHQLRAGVDSARSVVNQILGGMVGPDSRID
jgi:hypothetical protein